MPFKYACFISYANATDNELVRRITDDLYTALSNELGLLTNKKVFLDRKRMQVGYLLDEALASEFCQSVCMIVAFWPTDVLAHMAGTPSYSESIALG